jgi:hypothetical protein
VGCARNDKTECGTGNKAFFIHSGFDLQNSRRYVQYFQQHLQGKLFLKFLYIICSRDLISQTAFSSLSFLK